MSYRGARRRTSSLLWVGLALSVLAPLGASWGAALVGAPTPTLVGGSSTSAPSGATPAAAATPALALAPTSGAVGTLLTFNATAFAHATTFEITWPESKTVTVTACSGETTSKGTFNCTYTMPAHADGPLVFTATDGKGNSKTATFTIRPAVTVAPTIGSVETSVTFSATGFSANGTNKSVTAQTPAANGTVTWSGGTACAALISAVGSFSCSFTIPATYEGLHTFNATDPLGRYATTSFDVTPRLVVGPTYGPVGGTIVLTGTGFAASSAVTVTWSENSTSLGTACKAETAGTGGFSCSFTIPVGTPGGAYTFLATDAAGNNASTVFTVSVLRVSPTTAVAGTNLTFVAAGFTPLSSFSITWGAGSICAPGDTNATGWFSCSFILPPTPIGPHEFTGTDGAGISASVNVTVIAQVSVSPYGGEPGTAATFSGTGFAASSTVRVTWPDGALGCSNTSSAAGSFECGFRIPNGTVGGIYVFNATDASHDTATATFIVTFLRVTPVSGPVGTVLSFLAEGFAASSSFKTTWSGGTVSVCSGTTTAKGSFGCNYTLPATTVGPHVFTSVDGAGSSAEATFTVSSKLTVSPTTTTVGSLLKFAATGFAESSAISIAWSGGTICSGTTTIAGDFDCNETMPATPAGDYTFNATDKASDFASALVTITTSLTVKPTSGPVGTAVTFQASGFSALAEFSISWSGGTVCTTVTNVSGSVNCTYTILAATDGAHNFTGVDSSSHTAVAVFTITPDLVASPSSGPVGTPIDFSGEGFGADLGVTVTWNSGSTACTAETGSTGGFSCAFTIPATPAGDHTFTATDTATSPHTASTAFDVTPELTASPTSGPIGTTVTLVATGYAASSLIVVSWPSGTACNGTTSTAGSFTCTFKIPAGTGGGPALFTATDAASHSASVSFLVTPVLTVSPTSGPVGTPLTFTGAGFATSTKVTVTWPGGTACTATTSASGGFTCSFTVLPLPVGPHVFTATAGAANGTVTFTVTPKLSLLPTFGPPGAPVTIRGSGYSGNSSVHVTWSVGTACTTTTNASGSFNCTYSIPLGTPGGAYTFTGNETATISNSTAFVVTFVDATPVSGPIGTVVTFSAGGFNPASRFNLTWSGGTACSGTTTSGGTFTCTFALPAIPAGSYLFTGKDGSGIVATVSVQVVPSVSVVPTSDPTGSTVTFHGTGFAANSTLKVTGLSTTACSTGTDSVGNFTCTFVIPPGTAAGPYVFTATDGAGNHANVTLTVTPTLTASPVGGPPGTVVTFDGSGFATTSPITVVWTGGSACNATTNSTGSFNCTYTIPAGTSGGIYVFTATDGTSHSASARFTVTYVVGSPLNGVGGTLIDFTGGGFHASSTVTVVWDGGTVACHVTATTEGTFSCNYTIPVSTPLGLHTFTATDALNTSATTTFDVFGTPAVTPPTPTRTAADVNQTVSFSTNASGGSGTYPTYTWTVSSSALSCTIANAPSISCVAASPGSATVSVTVTDSNGVVSAKETSGTVKVTADPEASPITLNRTALDVGQTVAINVTALDGSGVYTTYAWAASSSHLGCAFENADEIVCAPNATGSYSVSVAITDSNGVTSLTVVSGSIIVSADPTVQTPTANHATIDVGQTVSFSVTTTPGSGGLVIVWQGLPANCTASDSAFTCRPNAPLPSGAITVTVTDSNGFTVTSEPLTFIVYPDPTVTTPAPAKVKPYDVGQTVTFSVTTPSTGSGGLTYVWTGLPKGCTAENASSITCASLADGNSTISVSVEDTNKVVATSGVLAFTVYLDPVVSTPSAGRSSADEGQSLTISVTVTQGAGSPTFLWSGLPAGCVAASSASISCPNLTTPDPYSIMVMVTDASGFTVASSTLAFTVDTDPAVSTPTANKPSVDINQTVTFSVVGTGGSGGLKYTWTGLPTGCPTGTGASVACTKPTTAGAFVVSVTATDSNGFAVSSGTLSFSVYAPPSVSIQVSPSTFLQGKQVTFTAVVTGGAPGALVYNWTALPPGCSAPDAATFSCRPSASGTYSITLSVTDVNKGTGTAESSLNVQPAFLGLPASEGYLVLTVAILAALAVVITLGVIYSRRRKKNRVREQLY